MKSRVGMTWKWKHKSKYHIMDFYKYYKRSIDRKTVYDVSLKTFHDVIYRANQLYTEALVSGKSIKPMPGLGEFQVYKYKQNPTKPVVDWGSYYRDGVYKMLSNEHTNGYRFFIKWVKYRRLHNIRCYKFSMILYAKRKLRDAIRAGLDAPVHDQYKRK